VFTKKVKILFIDDNEPNNVLTQAVIDADSMPIESFYALSIDKAISMLEGFEEAKNFPKLIFCDINLPVKDGYYFAKYYSEHFYEHNKEVKMFFMSADIQKDQFEELTQYPFVFDVYIKPFRDEIYDEAIKGEVDKVNDDAETLAEEDTSKEVDKDVSEDNGKKDDDNEGGITNEEGQ